jgi:CBS domain-containing protein
MTREVQCIEPDATLQDVARRMKELDVGSMPICDNDRLAGMITDRDIAIRSVSEGHDPHADHARDVMSHEVFYCFEDQSVEEVAEQMRDKQVRRLPVLNRDKRLVGIVSLGDLAIESGDEQLVGHALEGISEPSPVL